MKYEVRIAGKRPITMWINDEMLEPVFNTKGEANHVAELYNQAADAPLATVHEYEP